MGIRNVGGLSVYIIDAPAVESARTSTGIGYAQLVSQLRWKTWEAARQAVKDQMEFEKLGYEAKLDAFVKEKQELTRALAKTQDIKEKLKSGQVSASAAISAASLEYRIAKDRQNRADKLGLERITDRESINPITGEKETLSTYSSYGKKEGARDVGIPSAADLIKRGSAAVGYKSPEDKKAEIEAAATADKDSKEKAWLAAWKASGIKDSAEFAKSDAGKSVEATLQESRDKLAKIVATPAEELAKTEEDAKADQELADYESELQRRLDLLSVPAPTFDTNVLSRTRETFGGMAGVGGLGFAPRRRKVSPIYDEARAREAMGRAEAVESEAVSLSAQKKYDAKKAEALAIKEKARLNKIAELESFLGDPGLAQMAGVSGLGDTIKELRNTPVSLNEEEDFAIASSSKQEAQRELASGLLETGYGPRTSRQFMTREPREVPQVREIEQVLEPLPDPYTPGPMDRPPLDFPIVSGVGRIPGSPASPAVVSQRFESAKGSALGPPGTTSRPPNLEGIVEGVKPRVRSYPPTPVDLGTDPDMLGQRGKPPVSPTDEELVFGGGVVPSGALELDEENKDINIGELSPNVNRVLESPEAKKKKKEDASKQVFTIYGIDTDATDAEKLKVYEEFIIGGKDKDPAFKLNAEGALIDPAAAEWYKTTLDAIRATEGKTGKAQPKNRQDRSSAYALKIINKGKDLADKPAKLARLAKTDLPESERMKKVPEHIALVDKLYEINKTKGDVYKSTYSEIARVYEKQPKLRDAALEYLVAKNLLYGNIA
jgi:hypothetical protein